MTKKRSTIDNLQNLSRNKDNPLARLPEETRTLLLEVMDTYNIRENMVSNLWWRPVPFEETPGIIAIVTLITGVQTALVNAPVLPRLIHDHTLSSAEIMQLFLILSDIPGDAQIGADEQVIMLQLYMLGHVPTTDAATALDALEEGLWKMRSDLHHAVDIFLGQTTTQAPANPEPRLPKIKVYPKDMEVIFDVLSGCDAHAQSIFLYLIEKWEKRGGIITTTGASICLDFPYGDRQARMAILLPAYSRKFPVIGLFWGSLERLEGLPQEALKIYFMTVEKLFTLRKTESTAYIEVNEGLTQTKAHSLLMAMKTLAGKVDIEKIKAVPSSKTLTKPNLDETLKTCPPEWNLVYRGLIEEWHKVGGIVHCPRVGRIYLRLKTHAHEAGRISRQPHFFNLLVLAAPKGKHGCQIDIDYGLGTGYLDCIPEDANHFDQIISALPGFAQEGTVTRLKLEAGFRPEHCQLLIEAISALKIAEEKAL